MLAPYGGVRAERHRRSAARGGGGARRADPGRVRPRGVGGALGRAAGRRARERRADRASAVPLPLVALRRAAARGGAARAGAAAMTKQQLALVAAIMGSFVAGLDATVVNVALPSIRDDLGGGLAGQQWVSNAYLLTLGSLILVAGLAGRSLRRAARVLDRRRRVRRRLARVRAGADDRGAGRRPRAAGRVRRAADAERAGRDHRRVPARRSAAARSAPGPPGRGSRPSSGRSRAAGWSTPFVVALDLRRQRAVRARDARAGAVRGAGALRRAQARRGSTGSAPC